MAVNLSINGFGRIGRLVLRALVDSGKLGDEINVVAVNDLALADNLAYLFKYDSTQGKFNGEISVNDDAITLNGHKIKCLAVREGPSSMPWSDLGVDIVIESTGLFTQYEKAEGHLKAGAKKVII